jgi:transcriptional regulator with PAS, ATPase and Fis domain
VLAVPLRLRGSAAEPAPQVIGCIYVDHRLRRAAFDDSAATVLGELADIAAIAIGNAQLTGELRRRSDEIDRLNRALGAELAERDAELARVHAAGAAHPGGNDRSQLRHRYEPIAGNSPPVLQMLGLIDRAASTSFPVVIVGESGTGKELVARALHDHSTRRNGPFIAVNCSALPDTLLESELFGHVRGAFTGADRERRGMFEVAHQGTLFLDEIADTSPAMQARLLRVLQDGVVRRIGDAHTTTVDVRIVVATQRPLADLVAAGSFREDLRFRLEVLAIAVPPLRERASDLPILVEHLLRSLARDPPVGRAAPKLSRAAVRALAAHRWPGNVRELANVLAHGLAMASGETIELGDLPAAFTALASGAAPAPATPSDDGDLRLRPALRATERAYLAAAMQRSGGNQTQAARLLGLSRFGLQKKLRRGDTGEDADDEDGA